MDKYTSKQSKEQEEAVFSISRSVMLAEQSQIELGTIVNPATEEEEKPTPPPQQWLKALEGEDWSHTL